MMDGTRRFRQEKQRFAPVKGKTARMRVHKRGFHARYPHYPPTYPPKNPEKPAIFLNFPKSRWKTPVENQSYPHSLIQVIHNSFTQNIPKLWINRNITAIIFCINAQIRHSRLYFSTDFSQKKNRLFMGNRER